MCKVYIQISPLKVNSLGPEKNSSLYPRFTLTTLAKIKKIALAGLVCKQNTPQGKQ